MFKLCCLFAVPIVRRQDCPIQLDLVIPDGIADWVQNFRSPRPSYKVASVNLVTIVHKAVQSN